MIYTKSLNCKYETDVFIAGGGPSGVAAAVAASLACETEDVRKISVLKLQENLIKIGAYVQIHHENTDK